MKTTSQVKRLKPTPETLRELYIKSGNLCAFPDCQHLMMDAHGNFIGQVCHIEAAEEGGQRFNPNMSNEERRHVSNLVLMCYQHHMETNDVVRFTTQKMKEIKANHENRFSNPENAILDSLMDYTESYEAIYPKNLLKLNRVLGDRYDSEALTAYVQEIKTYIDKLRVVPLRPRDFLAKVSSRIHRINSSNPSLSLSGVINVDYPVSIRISDIEMAFSLSKDTIRDISEACESYGVGRIDQVTSAEGWNYHFLVYGTENDFPVWLDIVEFCEATSTSLDKFSVHLNFSCLDD